MLKIKISFSFDDEKTVFKKTKSYKAMRKFGIPSEFILDRLDDTISEEELEKKIIQEYVNRTK